MPYSYPIPPSDHLGVADLNAYLFGSKIGEGDHRTVYEVVNPATRYVYKIAKEGHRWANVAESDLWDVVKNTKYEKYFAPVHSVSPGGTVLCQARVSRLILPHEAPKYLPAFISDTHHGNLGIYEGRVVVFDYGIHLARTVGINGEKKSITRAWKYAQTVLKKERKRDPSVTLKLLSWG